MKVSLTKYISKQFSSPTGLGGKIISFIMNKQNRPLYEETKRLINLSGEDRVLDIGCGNGKVMSMLAENNKSRLTGIDPSESIIKDAFKGQKRFVKESRMDFRCEGVGKMSFSDSIFNKVYTINTVYFWDDIDEAMAEINRVLLTDGIFLNVLYSNETLERFSHTEIGYKRFSIEELKAAGYNNGFDVEVKDILNGDAYGVLYRKVN